MKKLYFLDDEERQRILNIHESATKRQYLSEQSMFSAGQGGYAIPTQNNAPKVSPKVAPKVAPIASPKVVPTASPKVASIASPKVAPKVAQNKQLAARRQQIISHTQTTTKSIQKLLGLTETGVMDSSLLQKINEKLNGNPQTPRPQVEPLQQLTPAGIKPPQLTTMSPEQLTAGLQQKVAGLKQ